MAANHRKKGSTTPPKRRAGASAPSRKPGNGTATRPASRGEIVYRGLRRAIVEQALTPSTKLPEDVIGDRFGVSRTVVRGALTRLAADGLVELRMNRGATVSRPSRSEAHDVFDIRRSLERLVVGRLAGRLSKPDAARLKAHVVTEQQAKGKESIRLAGEFHVLLAELTGNRILAGYVSELVSRSSLILALYGGPHSSDCAATEHLSIIDALNRGDASAVQRTMDEHLDAVIGRALIAPAPDRDIREVLLAYAPQ